MTSLQTKLLTPEEFADKATAIIWKALSKLPSEERARRLAAFEKTVKEICARRQADVRA